MVTYKCYDCDKIYNNKCDYNRHLQRKKPCKMKKTSATSAKKIAKNRQEKSTTKYQCDFCLNLFTRKDSLDKHLSSRCKVKTQQDQNKEQILNDLLEEMKNLRKQNEELKTEMINIKQNNTNINHGNIDNSTNKTIDNSTNNTININLVAFGKENYDNLTEKDYKNIINKGYKSIQELVKMMHFNKNRPENHNIYISNIRDTYVIVYDGSDWKLRTRKEAIEE